MEETPGQVEEEQREKPVRCQHQLLRIEERTPLHTIWDIDLSNETCSWRLIEGVQEQGVRVICRECGETRYLNRYKPNLLPHIQQALVLIARVQDPLLEPDHPTDRPLSVSRMENHAEI